MQNQRRGNQGGFSSRPRELHNVKCSACGASTQVPFKPTEGRPVYCRECFQKQKGGNSGGGKPRFNNDRPRPARRPANVPPPQPETKYEDTEDFGDDLEDD